jgi:hypothetical protein
MMLLWFIAQYPRTFKHTNDNRGSLGLEYTKINVAQYALSYKSQQHH